MFDKTDIRLIFEIYEDKGQTTTDLAKKIFKCDKWSETRKYDSLVRQRLKRLSEKSLVLCSDEAKPKTYSVNPKFVFTGKGQFNLKVNGSKKIEFDFGDFMVLTDGKDYLNVYPIVDGK